MLRKLLPIFLAAFIPALAYTQTAPDTKEVMQLSLSQAIDYALSHKSEVVDAQIDQKIATQKVREITGSGLPQLNGSFELQDFIVRPTTVFPDFLSPAVYGVLIKENLVPSSHFPEGGASIPVQFGTKYNGTIGVSASQMVFDGSFLIGLKAAKVYTQLAQKMTDRTRIDVVENITKAYYGIIINYEHKKLLEANLARLQKIYDDTKAYNEAGFAEKIDVDRLKVQLTNLSVENEKVERMLEISRDLLKFQMGMLVTSEIKLTDTLSYTAIAEEANAKIDYNNRIEYSIVKTQEQLYALDVKRNQAGYLPSINAYGTLSSQALRNDFTIFDAGQQWYASFILGAKLNVPIFDGFQKSARIQQAKLNLLKANNDENNLKNAIDFQVSSSQITYDNAVKTMEEQKQNMNLAQDVARVSQVKYKEGVGSNLEVVTAETELREAQSNYFDALYNLIIARTDLLKAEGKLAK